MTIYICITHEDGNKSGGQLSVERDESGETGAPGENQQSGNVRDGDSFNCDLSRFAIAESIFQGCGQRSIFVILKQIQKTNF